VLSNAAPMWREATFPHRWHPDRPSPSGNLWVRLRTKLPLERWHGKWPLGQSGHKAEPAVLNVFAESLMRFASDVHELRLEYGLSFPMGYRLLVD
jgi:hypothetical protein